MAMDDLEQDPALVNDAERYIEQKLFKAGEEYAESNRRQKVENKERAESRNRIKEMGISTHAFQIAVKVVKDLTPGERADWIRDFQAVVKVLGAKQKELFPEEAMRAEKRAQQRAEKAAGSPRSTEELNAATDTNPASDPKNGGAQVDLEEAIAKVTESEQAEGEAALQQAAPAITTQAPAAVPKRKPLSQSEKVAAKRAAAGLA